MRGLNSEQEKAVLCTEGPVLIVAGAGSGKTRVLTSRVAYIISRGTAPETVMALTFTKKAATEMKERIALMVGERQARHIVMGTFHSVFVRFLREYAEKIGFPKEFTIYDQSDSISAVKAVVKMMGLDEKIYKPKEVLSRISKAKNDLVTPAMYVRNSELMQADSRAKKPKICEIYNFYLQECRKAGVMDFDDILLYMNILLRDCPEALESISSRFTHILVDEYQDTNSSQYLILKKLAAKHGNICVVGDDSQSIYAFRGAKIENILKFQKDYPGSHVFRLERNYRSTRTIVEAANSLIEKNTSRIPKKCYSEAETGDLIKFIPSANEQEEAAEVVSTIIARMNRDKAQYKDFAILYRTNSQSRVLEEYLRRRNIPYMIYSGNSFFERSEVKDLMAYFKLAVNPFDNESFKRVVNRPARGIGDTSLSALTLAARELNLPLLKACYDEKSLTYGLKPAAREKLMAFGNLVGGFWNLSRSGDAFAVAQQIASDSGLLAFYKADTSVEGQARTANVEELLSAVKSYVEDTQTEEFETLKADGKIPADQEEIRPEELSTVLLSDFLENTLLLSNADTEDRTAEDEEDATNRVSLMTVHSAKGLEFPYVFVTGMEEGLFPSGGWLIEPSEMEEERRLCYVAMTRAMKALYMSYADSRMKNGERKNNPPSHFLSDIDSKYISNPVAAQHKSSFDFSSFMNPRTASGFPTQAASHPSPRPGAGFAPRPVAKPTVQARPTVQPGPAAGPAEPFIPDPVNTFAPGQRIEHNRFGKGLILSISGTGDDRTMQVRFDNYGEKKLVLKYVKMRVLK